MGNGNRDPNLWVTADGRSVAIAEMEDGHVINVIAFLRRRATTYAAKHGLDAEVLLIRHPQYPTLLAQVAARGLISQPVRSDAAADQYSRFAELIFDDAAGEA